MRLIRLSPGDWAMITTAYWWLAWARWQMLTGRLKGREWLENGHMRSCGMSVEPRDADDECITRRVRFINLGARYPYGWARCLQTSLALRQWLARKGVRSDLRIGVRKNDQNFQAHAWLEYRGKILNDHPMIGTKFAQLVTVRGSAPEKDNKLGRKASQ